MVDCLTDVVILDCDQLVLAGVFQKSVRYKALSIYRRYRNVFRRQGPGPGSEGSGL